MSTSRRRPRLAIAALVVAWATLVSAEEPALELEVSPTSVRVGDRVRVVAAARGGEGLLWGEPTVGLEPDGPWELVDPPTAVAEASPPVWELTLAPMALGEQPLPMIGVTVRAPDGATTDIAAEATPTVTVISTLAADEENPAPAPLRDPIGVHGLPWEWILPAVGLLLPVLAGGIWWWRGRGHPASAPRPALPPLHELEALLSELEGRLGREPADGICDRLAGGLRRYLERRTGDPAQEMTSFELRLLARRRSWPEATQRMVQQVMAVADGVRFSRRPATDDELRRALGLAGDTARTLEAFLEPADEAAAVEAG